MAIYDTRDLNWKDDVDSFDGRNVNDPITRENYKFDVQGTVNSFNKGYQYDPYSIRQYAHKCANLIKKAYTEVDVLSFTPEYLADKILKIWNGVDGTLQDYYTGFCLRYDNDLKIKIANVLKSMGYEVYPLLLDNRKRYAKLITASNNKNLNDIIDVCLNIYPNSIGLYKFAEDINTSRVDSNELLEYYKGIFPDDFALSLVYLSMNDNDKIKKWGQPYNTQLKQDIQLSDESLEKIEDIMSGNADPYYRNTNNNNYDFVTDTRLDTVSPNTYEVTSAMDDKKKVKIK